MSTFGVTQAEMSLLGALLIDGALARRVELAPEDFSTQSHAVVFEAIQACVERGETPDLVVVQHELEQKGRLEWAGGAAYLAGLLDGVPDVENVEGYAKIVREDAIRRAVQAHAQRLASDAEVGNGVALAEEAQRALLGIAARATQGGPLAFDKITEATRANVEKILKHGGKIAGVPTGFRRLDEITTGLHRSDLIILAARPGMGKTAFAGNLARHIALSGRRALFFSLEMSAEQLGLRLVCDLAGVSMSRVRAGLTSRAERRALLLASAILEKAPLHIDETPGLTVSEIHARADKVARLGGLDAVFVDYLQIMGSRGKVENRTQEVGTFSRGLKLMAKDIRVPVMALSQLSREVEKREDREPQLSDLRDSGAIEQDADIVLFLSRAGYYDQNAAMKNVTDVIVAKHRNGALGRFVLGWRGDLTRFADLVEVNS